MTMYILDTDILTLFQEGDALVCARALQKSPPSIATTVLSIEEQLSGWYAQVRQAKTRDDQGYRPIRREARPKAPPGTCP
jgi:tRNA(fMet)-specific endonuclease VapC